MVENISQPIFRFAPSPNGQLHLGHAYSVLLNYDMAKRTGGRLLLRIEDIDTTRCTPQLEEQMLDDLHWLGIEWEGIPRRQSEHFVEYQKALDKLAEQNLLYPAFMSRGEIKRYIADNSDTNRPWPKDPDGAPLYPDIDRDRDKQQRLELIASGKPYALRLDMEAAMAAIGNRLDFEEQGSGPQGEAGKVACDPSLWGDVILGRKELPTSYHLSVVLDDALQNITHIVRGRDLFYATFVHRLLQELLGLRAPIYHHHDLILSNDGRKASKSADDTSLRTLRKSGRTPDDIRHMVGLACDQ